MNYHTRLVLQQFASVENKKHLQDVLLRHHLMNPEASALVRQSFDTQHTHFIHRVAKEMSDSDPMPGMSPVDYMRMLNIEFLEDANDFINSRVVGESAPRYTVGDNHATSRYGSTYQMAPANSKLNVWYNNAGSGITLREDSHADSGHSTYYNGGAQTGIDFCDQSNMNTSNHVAQFFTPSMIALNNDPDPHTATGFGQATKASDARLLSRRIFKNNDRGQEGGIRAHERRLHNRHVDRDVRESLQGREREAQTYGYNMQTLYDRIDYKNQVKAKPLGSRDQPPPPPMYTWDREHDDE